MAYPYSRSLDGFKHFLGRRDDHSGTWTDRDYSYTVFYGGAQIAMIVVAVILVIICALLTGLTLAVCGLDINYVQLRSVAGGPQERRQAQEVIRMKRRANWMLCSLVLCSVACSQTFPFVIQSVWHGPQFWVPVLISTVTMTVFVEIIPQYLIPQQAIAWGYYSWPVIWGCMWTTCIITFPLGWLLDKLQTMNDRNGIFTNNELQAIIRYHDQSEKRGGMVGQDAARVMLGALKLNSQRIGHPQLSRRIPNEQDIEKGDQVSDQTIIVKWDAVKTIDINDTVDEAFIRRIQSWSYSRIPVVGNSPQATNHDSSSTGTKSWEGNRVFGFLHVKNLIGIDTKITANAENKLKVKDLTLYPLPIVGADMTVYELLNFFQLGMSRMAIVVRESSATGNDKTGSPLWTASDMNDAHLLSNAKEATRKPYWTRDCLKIAQAAAVDEHHHRQNVLDIDCPKPLGIVTFEDVIDTILQKTSRDERDFFDRGCSCPPTKSKKSGDSTPDSVPSRTETDLPGSPRRAHVTFEKSVHPGTMRKRKVSNKASAVCVLDGADDRNFGECRPSSIRLQKNRRRSTRSSYTDNSAGGFHGADESCNVMDNANLMTPAEIVEMANTSSSACPGNPYSHIKTASLPMRGTDSAISEEKGRQEVSSVTRLPQSRHVAPFSGETVSGSAIETGDRERGETTELSMPLPFQAPRPIPVVAVPFRYNASDSEINVEQVGSILRLIDAEDLGRERSGETVSLMSWSSDDDAKQMTRICDAVPILPVDTEELPFVQKSLPVVKENKEYNRPYDGFPPELLDNTRKENRLPEHISKTLPRSTGADLILEELAEKTYDLTPPARERSFHDDRALLPSQTQLLEHSSLGLGTRSSSMWF